MATSSIFHNVVIDSPEKCEKLLDAIEKSTLHNDLEALDRAVSILYDLGNREGLEEDYFQKIAHTLYALQDIVTRERIK